MEDLDAFKYTNASRVRYTHTLKHYIFLIKVLLEIYYICGIEPQYVGLSQAIRRVIPII